MSKKLNIILLISILVLAAVFRLVNLENVPPGLYSDEAMNGNNAVEAWKTGNFKVFYEENNGREGLFINLQAVLIGFISPISPIGLIGLLRLPSAIFGILTVLGAYLLTKQLISWSRVETIALLAAFLLATSFWHINFSRIGFRAIMAPALLTWAVYLLLKAYRTNWTNKSYWSYWPAILAGLLYGLGFHSYIAYRATPLLILLIFYWTYKTNWSNRSYWITTALFLLGTFITVLPLGLYFLENPQDFFGRTTQVSILNSPTPLKDLGFNIIKTLGMFNFVGDFNWRHNIAGRPLLFWPVGILLLIGLFIAITKRIKNYELGIKILFAWLIVTALPVVISNEGLPHALRAILMAPPVFIFAALGGFWLYEKIKPIGPIGLIRPIGLIGLIGLIVLLVVEAYVSYFIIWAQNPAVADAFNQKYVAMGKLLNELPKEMPKYIVMDTGGHDVRKIGTPVQTIMYVTNTFLMENQEEKNIHYISPSQKENLPPNSFIIIL